MPLSWQCRHKLSLFLSIWSPQPRSPQEGSQGRETIADLCRLFHIPRPNLHLDQTETSRSCVVRIPRKHGTIRKYPPYHCGIYSDRGSPDSRGLLCGILPFLEISGSGNARHYISGNLSVEHRATIKDCLVMAAYNDGVLGLDARCVC